MGVYLDVCVCKKMLLIFSKKIWYYENMKSLSTLLGMTFMGIGLLVLAYSAVVLSDVISPPRGDLTLAEAILECEAKEINSQWAYDGGFDDCVAFRTGKLTAAEAKTECALMEERLPGVFPGGVDACEVLYNDGQTASINFHYSYSMMLFSGCLSLLFLFVGGVMLYYADRPNKKIA